MNDPHMDSPAKGKIMVYSGRMVDPATMTPDDVTIEDIAHALACSNRFGGHAPEPYNVAQHSVLVARILPDELKLQGLLHDAHEAYVVDMPRPLKVHLPDYQRLELHAANAVRDHYNLPRVLDKCVELADRIMLTTEAKAFRFSWWQLWAGEAPPDELLAEALRGSCGVWGWREAERAFLDEFDRLWG